MAVTKIWPVRGNLARPLRYVENPEKTGTEIEMDDSDLQSLSDVMQYAANEEKTEHRYFVTGIRCYPETARTQFMTVKKQFAKEGGIICFHAYQSFAPGEADPEAAHRAGVELAERLWGDRGETGIDIMTVKKVTGSCRRHQMRSAGRWGFL